jgi:hypothetical protein
MHNLGKEEAQVNALVGFGHVVIQIRWPDLGVGGEDVADQSAKIDSLEVLDQVIKDIIVNTVNEGRKLAMGDCCLCLVVGDVAGMEFCVFSSSGTIWNDGIGRRFIGRDGECFPILGQIDG